MMVCLRLSSGYKECADLSEKKYRQEPYSPSSKYLGHFHKFRRQKMSATIEKIWVRASGTYKKKVELRALFDGQAEKDLIIAEKVRDFRETIEKLPEVEDIWYKTMRETCTDTVLLTWYKASGRSFRIQFYIVKSGDLAGGVDAVIREDPTTDEDGDFIRPVQLPHSNKQDPVQTKSVAAKQKKSEDLLRVQDEETRRSLQDQKKKGQNASGQQQRP